MSLATPLQCVILTGRLESNHLPGLVTNGQSKALLPVADKPLLWYLMSTICEQLPNSELIVVTTPEHHDSISAYIHLCQKDILHFTNPIQFVESGNSDVSLPVIAELKPYLSSELFYLISVDSFGPLPLKLLYDCHVADPNTLCTILLIEDELLKNASSLDARKKKKEISTKENTSSYSDIVTVCIDRKHQRLLGIRNFNEMQEGDDLKLPHASVPTNGLEIEVATCFRDIHVYLLKHSLLDMIETVSTKFSLDSFRLDFIPLLTAFQTNMEEFHLPNGSVRYVTLNPSKHLQLPQRILNYEIFRNLNMKFCSPSLYELQSELPNNVVNAFPKPTYVIKGISKDSRIEVNTNIHETVIIKKSFIDKNCSIKEKTKISSSVVFPNVQIGSKCVLSQSIICSEGTIGDGCQLVNCVVEYGITIPENTIAENEIFSSTDSNIDI